MQDLISGLAIGSVYALVAIGFVLLYNAVGLVNFAHGELLMLGAFFAAWMIGDLEWPTWQGYGGSLAAMVLVGLAMYVLLYKTMRERSLLVVVVGTVGIGIALQNLSQIVWGPRTRALPGISSSATIQIFGSTVSTQYLFIMATTFVMLLFLFTLMKFTAVGKQMRAVSFDQSTAQLMGIRVSRIVLLTFVLSSVFAGVAGILIGPVFLVSAHMGLPLLFKAFSAVVIGGFGSLPGAVLGGLLIGVVEVFAAVNLSNSYRDAYAFLLLIAFLVFRPEGIFGEPVSEKL